jgi:hypothetical protein
LTCSCDPSTSSIIGGICVNCSSILHNNGVDHDNNDCLCVSPYQWVWTAGNQTGVCLCNSSFSIIPSAGVCLNCSTLSYAIGTVTNNTCDCAPTFAWNASNLTCSCDPSTSSIIGGICVNCSSILNNNGTNGYNSDCLCASPYQWHWNTDNQTGLCLCNATF